MSSPEASFIDRSIEEFAANPRQKTGIISPPLPPSFQAICPGLLLWNPVQSFGATLRCSECQNSTLFFNQRWTKGKRHSPRLLYNLGRNLRLVSALYQCNTCHTDALAHADKVLNQLAGICDIPFILFNKSGVSISAYGTINDCIAEGMSFNGVKHVFEAQARRTMYQTLPVDVSEEKKAEAISNCSEMPAFRCPSFQMARDIFMHEFYIKKPKYDKFLASFEPVCITLDHTFHISKCARVLIDGKKARQFECVLFVLDATTGLVLYFTLAQSKSLSHVSEDLSRVAAEQGRNLRTIVTGKN
jgi:hypothetical protein